MMSHACNEDQFSLRKGAEDFINAVRPFCTIPLKLFINAGTSAGSPYLRKASVSLITDDKSVIRASFTSKRYKGDMKMLSLSLLGDLIYVISKLFAINAHAY